MESIVSDVAKSKLRGMTLPELEAWVVATLGAKRFHAQQIFRWIHATGATSAEGMTDVAKELRARLAEVADLEPLATDLVQVSADGTRKIRFKTCDGRFIESVLIPEGDKVTQCISSQVGCALDCTFCATASLGFGRNLGADEIVEQVYRGAALAREAYGEDRRITNLVFMGMGEPLHNYDHVVRAVRILTDQRGMNFSSRRVTVSTAGMVPQIAKLGREDFQVNLAISLNASDDKTRDVVMPINKKWPIAELIGAIKKFPLQRRRFVMFEYVLLGGVNDSVEDAVRVAKLLKGMPCKVNLLPWNPHPLAPYQRPEKDKVVAFQRALMDRGFAVYIRKTRGDDIDAACGQLAARELQPAGSERPALELSGRRPAGLRVVA